MVTITILSKRRRGSYLTSNKRQAVEARVRRKLSRQGEKLGKCPANSRWHSSLGDYYVMDAATRLLLRPHQHLDDLAVELNVLAKGVEIAE